MALCELEHAEGMCPGCDSNNLKDKTCQYMCEGPHCYEEMECNNCFWIGDWTELVPIDKGINEYQEQALRTARVNDELQEKLYRAVGLCGETGEVARLIASEVSLMDDEKKQMLGMALVVYDRLSYLSEHIKKHTNHGHEFNDEYFTDMLYSLLSSVHSLCDTVGINPKPAFNHEYVTKNVTYFTKGPKQVDRDELTEELGDVQWYANTLPALFGIKSHTILEKNIQKLRKRYQEGFSEEKSRDR